jgi:hypothetical protein
MSGFKSPEKSPPRKDTLSHKEFHDCAEDVCRKYFNRLLHFYDKKTPELKYVLFLRDKTVETIPPTIVYRSDDEVYIQRREEASKLQKSLVERIVRESTQRFFDLRAIFYHIVNKPREWSTERHSEMVVTPETREFVLAQIIKDAQLLRDVVHNYKRFIIAYIYYYITNYTDYLQYHLPPHSRKYLYNMVCALHENSCDEDEPTRSETEPSPFDRECDEVDKIVIFLSFNPKWARSKTAVSSSSSSAMPPVPPRSSSSSAMPPPPPPPPPRSSSSSSSAMLEHEPSPLMLPPPPPVDNGDNVQQQSNKRHRSDPGSSSSDSESRRRRRT